MADKRAVAGAVVVGGVAIALLVVPNLREPAPGPQAPPPREVPARDPVAAIDTSVAGIGKALAPALARLLESERDPQVRANALASLGRFPADADARAALLAAMQKTRPREERLVALAVLRTGPWRDELRAFITDDDPTVREAAKAAVESKER